MRPNSTRRFQLQLAAGMLAVICLGGLTASMPSPAKEDDAAQILATFQILDSLLGDIYSPAQIQYCENVFKACAGKNCAETDLAKFANDGLDATPAMQQRLLVLTRTLSAKQAQQLIDAIKSYRLSREKADTFFRTSLENLNSSYHTATESSKNAYLTSIENIKSTLAAGRMAELQEAIKLKARDSSVKANMHTLQTIVETYAVDWGGVYATSMTGLKAEATIIGRDYWTDFVNPYTGGKGLGKGGAYLDYKTFNSYAPPQKAFAGMVIYQPILPEPVTVYKIWGCDEKGNLIKDKGQDFFLTNS